MVVGRSKPASLRDLTMRGFRAVKNYQFCSENDIFMQVDVFKNQLLYFAQFFNVPFYKKYSSFNYRPTLGMTFLPINLLN